MRLWLRHVLEAEAATRLLPRAFLSWPDFLADWRGGLAVAGHRLGRAWTTTLETERAVDDFLAPDLRRQRGGGQEAPLRLVETTSQALFHLARRGEDPALHAVLDGVSEDFEAACALFADA